MPWVCTIAFLRVATTLHGICILYYLGCFMKRVYLGFCGKCSIDYFVLIVITQILIMFYALVVVNIKVLCLITLTSLLSLGFQALYMAHEYPAVLKYLLTLLTAVFGIRLLLACTKIQYLFTAIVQSVILQLLCSFWHASVQTK